MLVIEIGLAVGGLLALVTGKVPSFVVGGGKYRVEGMAARLFGILLMSPIPLIFAASIWLVFFMGEEGAEYAGRGITRGEKQNHRAQQEQAA